MLSLSHAQPLSCSASLTQQQGCHKVEINVWFRCLGLICDLIGVGLICDLWLWVCFVVWVYFMVAVGLLVVAVLCWRWIVFFFLVQLLGFVVVAGGPMVG